jgi:UDPglucose 6-dehydrogenase
MLGDTVTYADNAYAALDGADALIVVTDWLDYRTPDFDRIRQLLRTPTIIDGRNLYDPRKLRALGFAYVGVGRGA